MIDKNGGVLYALHQTNCKGSNPPEPLQRELQMKNRLTIKKRIIIAVVTSSIAIVALVIDAGVTSKQQDAPTQSDDYGVHRAEAQEKLLTNIENK